MTARSYRNQRNTGGHRLGSVAGDGHEQESRRAEEQSLCESLRSSPTASRSIRLMFATKARADQSESNGRRGLIRMSSNRKGGRRDPAPRRLVPRQEP